MPMKKFTNNYQGNASRDIWINSDLVLSVYGDRLPDPNDLEKTINVTNIYTAPGLNFVVDDPMDEVIARLNEA